MTIEEIQKLMHWSMKKCLNEALTVPLPTKNTETYISYLEHILMRAFMSSAFTLWTRLVSSSCALTVTDTHQLLTRCFELLTLQARDIVEGCRGPAPYYIPHFKVHLENRKGWQKDKGYEGPRTSKYRTNFYLNFQY